MTDRFLYHEYTVRWTGWQQPEEQCSDVGKWLAHTPRHLAHTEVWAVVPSTAGQEAHHVAKSEAREKLLELL